MTSEVPEPEDVLPFVEDTTPSFDSSERILAPSIDEVDSNPEDLRNMRGKGRYFGVEDPSDSIGEAEPKCNNCAQKGHFKRNCPHVICSYCGLMDDHYSQQCPKAIKCANCNGEGHYRSQCPHKWKRVNCVVCNSNSHSRDRCPSIWRSYFLLDSSSRRNLPVHKIYCYNCGEKGHFGDDCWEYRSSRVPNEDGSAFSGENLPQKLKPEYYRHLDNASRDYTEERRPYSYEPKVHKSSRNYSRFDEGNYLEESSSSQNKKSKKRKREKESTSVNNSNFYPPPYQRSKNAPRPSSQGNTLPPKQKKRTELRY